MSIVKSKQSISETSEISNIQNEEEEKVKPFKALDKLSARDIARDQIASARSKYEIHANKPSIIENPMISPSDV